MEVEIHSKHFMKPLGCAVLDLPLWGFCYLKHFTMKFYNTTKLALVLAAQAYVDGMKASNSQRPDDQKYNDIDFRIMSEEILRLSKLPDAISGTEVKLVNKKPVNPESNRKLNADSLMEILGYSPVASDIFSVKVEKTAKIFYRVYLEYCIAEKLTPLSVVKFAYAMRDLGFLKERKADGQTYTLYTTRDERKK